jgi:hypothetical protein
VLQLLLIILLVGGDVPIDNDALLVIDFANLKIKLTQSFRGTHRGRVCVHMFIGVNAHTYISIYIYTVFLKKYQLLQEYSVPMHEPAHVSTFLAALKDCSCKRTSLPPMKN